MGHKFAFFCLGMALSILCVTACRGEGKEGGLQADLNGVKVTGTLAQVKNVESKEKTTLVYVLNLEGPVTVLKNENGEGPAENAKMFQIALSSKAEIICGKEKVSRKALDTLLGKKLAVTGRLSYPFSVHHIHQIVMLATRIECQ